MDKTLWVFHGEGGRFASGVFSNLELATVWISQNKLTGLLTEYPCDMAVYYWAIENDFFEAKKEDE